MFPRPFFWPIRFGVGAETGMERGTLNHSPRCRRVQAAAAGVALEAWLTPILFSTTPSEIKSNGLYLCFFEAPENSSWLLSWIGGRTKEGQN